LPNYRDVPHGRIFDIETMGLCHCGRYPTHVVLRIVGQIDGKALTSEELAIHARGFCHSCSPFVAETDRGYQPVALSQHLETQSWWRRLVGA
jgi:Ni2+-binding GTPase involved in maturation of urease and hydrogenase